jgi:hypothetical protein
MSNADSLRDTSLLLLLSNLLCLILFLYVLNSNSNHGLQSIGGIITSIVEMPADDAQFGQNATKLFYVSFSLEISPHECRISRLQQVG